MNEMNARLVARREVGEEYAVFRFEPIGWEVPDFLPGRFLRLGLPIEDAESGETSMVKRPYSIVSSPTYVFVEGEGLRLAPERARRWIEMYLKRVEGGVLSPRLFQLQVGDLVSLTEKPMGPLYLQQAPEDVDLVLFGTGTGLAPYISMLRSALQQQSHRRFFIGHGVRHQQDLAYHEELRFLAQQHSRLNYEPVLSRPTGAWDGCSGYVQDLWSEKVEQVWGRSISPQNTHVFLCGHPQMIEEMLDILQKEGFTKQEPSKPGQVHLEYYWRT